MTEQSFVQRCIETARQLPEQQAGALDWLQPWRETSLQQLAQVGLPQRKTETWRYTSIYPLVQGDFLRLSEVRGPRSENGLAGFDSYRIQFYNGVLDLEGSDLKGLPFELVPFRQANAGQRDEIRRLLESAPMAQHPFALLNAGWLQDGVLIRIAPNTRLDKPIQVVFDQGGGAQSFSAQPRLLVQLGHHAEAVLIEQHLGQAGTEIFSNLVADIRLDEGAKLDHYQFNLEPDNILHLSNAQVALEGHAQYAAYLFTLGGKLKRRELEVAFNRPGGHADLYGVYLGRDDQHVDLRTVLDHRAPHCTSQELIKGIVRDEARAIFNGRIHIHPNAQKTAAEMSNKNLLLSKTAEVNTKPELEIYADDVKCAHGATVGQLDKNALFYLRSRGIDAREAASILSDAFVYEALAAMPLEALKQYVARWVRAFHGQEAQQEEFS